MRFDAALYTATGEIVGIVYNTTALALGDSLFVQLTGDCNIDDFYVADGVVVAKGTQPSADYVFDYTTKLWVFDIALAQGRKWAEMKLARDAEEFGGLVFQGNTYDTDALSQQRIQGASQLATLDAITEIDWTTADNTTVTLTKSDVINLGVALGAHITTAHERGRIVRQQIEAATTEAELEAITWPTS